MSISDFTYSAYKEMLTLIKDCGYAVVGYGEGDTLQKRCILRHDIDYSMEKSLRLAELERECGAKSTYFVLLRTDFYNPFSARYEKMLRQIAGMGHTIGLHFDETAYPAGVDVPSAIRREADVLEQATGEKITVVSMHRPSKATLTANYRIEGMINSYSNEYFKSWKYISDSRRRWRENAEEVISCGEYPNLHILTHAFWYGENESDITETVRSFIESALYERYDILADNITDLESVLKKEEL